MTLVTPTPSLDIYRATREQLIASVPKSKVRELREQLRSAAEYYQWPIPKRMTNKELLRYVISNFGPDCLEYGF